MSIFNEASYENSIIELLESMGYTHVYGPDVERNHRSYYMADELRLLSVAAQLLLEEQSRREKPLCGLRQQLPHQVLSGERTAGRQL